MPAYMAGRWVAQCLESILAQTMPDFEVVISDNGSTDDTYAICQSFAARDGRIRVLRQPSNIGVAGNHNLTLREARAPYFCWLSANDIYDAHFLERCLAVLDASSDVVLVAPRASNFIDTPGDGKLDAESYLPDVRDPRRRLYAVMSSTRATRVFRGVYRRSALDAKGPLKAMFGNDHLLVVELATIGRIVQIPGPLYYERISAGARTASVPLRRRAQYYEPGRGISSMLFHRTRVLGRFWGIAWRHAPAGWRRLAVIAPMLRVMLDLRRLPLRDLREVAGLVREYLRRGAS